MARPKIGLVLGGGGGKGSYQVGVYQALAEHGYVASIQAISGTSIGALNLTVFALQQVETAISIWRLLSRRSVLTLKPMKEYLKRDGPFSLFSRDGMLRIFSETIDLSMVSSCAIPLYVGATEVEEPQGAIFQLNGKSTQEIEQILLASSAIPGVFDPVVMEGKTYYDGYKYCNVPIQPLVDEGCTLLFVIPLSEYGAPDDSMFPGVTLVDFKDPNFVDVGRWNGTFGFDHELAEERIRTGYEYADRLLTKLEAEGVLSHTRRQRIKYAWLRFWKKRPALKPYYGLADIGVVRLKQEEQENNRPVPNARFREW